MQAEISCNVGEYYPVFLNLKNKKALVCGGGNVAERKVIALLRAGATITVVSPDITPRLEREKKKGTIHHIRRTYRRGDLKNVFLVIGATDSPAVNERISRTAKSLVNIVDTPDLCNFIVPSVIQRGPLTIAISTSGISPALSRTIRLELQKNFGQEFSSYLQFLKKVRREVMLHVPNSRKRRKLLRDIASEDMLNMLREKGLKEVKKTINHLLTRANGV